MIHSNLFRHIPQSYTLWQFNYVIEGIMYCCVPTVPTHPTKCRWARATGKVMRKREGQRKVVLEFKGKLCSKVIPEWQVLHTTKYSFVQLQQKAGQKSVPATGQGNPSVGLMPLS